MTGQPDETRSEDDWRECECGNFHGAATLCAGSDDGTRPVDDLRATIDRASHLPALQSFARSLLDALVAARAERDSLRLGNEGLRNAVAAARAEVTRLEAENERLNRQLGECIGCVDEPDECCPQHGRTCADWIEIASRVTGRTNAVRDLLDQAAHWHVYEPRELGEAFLVDTVRDWLDEVRAALDAWPAAALGGVPEDERRSDG